MGDWTHQSLMGRMGLVARKVTALHTSFFITKKEVSLCYGLGLDLVHQDFPFQSIREKEFQKRIKGMANSCFAVSFFVTSRARWQNAAAQKHWTRYAGSRLEISRM